ncbi:UNVERIFIED_CONTAM: hypothetical protein RMT77_005003 [Armadillidium vulgare]
MHSRLRLMQLKSVKLESKSKKKFKTLKIICKKKLNFFCSSSFIEVLNIKFMWRLQLLMGMLLLMTDSSTIKIPLAFDMSTIKTAFNVNFDSTHLLTRQCNDCF